MKIVVALGTLEIVAEVWKNVGFANFGLGVFSQEYVRIYLEMGSR